MRKILADWWPIAAVLVVAIALQQVVYRVTDADCRERGGHTEIVYGGRGGWTCAGADR
jgi:hypothetical protein